VDHEPDAELQRRDAGVVGDDGGRDGVVFGVFELEVAGQRVLIVDVRIDRGLLPDPPFIPMPMMPPGVRVEMTSTESLAQ
jgi:hypothetical protein